MIDISIYPDGTVIHRIDSSKANRFNLMWDWYYDRYYKHTRTFLPDEEDLDFDYRDYCHPRCENIVKEGGFDWSHKGLRRWLTPRARFKILHQHVYLKALETK